MKRYDKSIIEELKKAIYYSGIHDARLAEIKHDYETKSLCVRASEYGRDREIKLIFTGVEFVLYTHSNEWPGFDEKTIISFSAEDDYSHLNRYIKYDAGDNVIYVLFQMLNGDELLIVSRTVEIQREN